MMGSSERIRVPLEIFSIATRPWIASVERRSGGADGQFLNYPQASPVRILNEVTECQSDKVAKR
jgi:hypothetical protein